MRESEETMRAAQAAFELIKAGQHHEKESRDHIEQANKCYNEASERLLEAFLSSLFQYCDGLLDGHGTDDIVSSVFLDTRAGMPKFRGEHGVPSLVRWLRTIATHQCFEELKRRKRADQARGRAARRVAHTPKRGNDVWLDDMPEDTLRQAIEQLHSDKTKIILRMKICKDMKIIDIADIMDMKPPAVQKRIEHAYRQIKIILGLE